MRTPVICAALFMLVMSVVLFVLMGADKRFARHEMRRVPEKKLILFALLGGAPGGLDAGCRAARRTGLGRVPIYINRKPLTALL